MDVMQQKPQKGFWSWIMGNNWGNSGSTG